MIQVTNEQVDKIKQLMASIADAETPQDGEFVLGNVLDIFPFVPRTTVQSRLNILVRQGKLSVRKSGQTNFYKIVDGSI